MPTASSRTPPTGVVTLTSADAYASLKDTMGRFRTQSLFVEMKHDKYPAPFTLKDSTHKGAVSMYAKYMEIGDPTEYTQAIALLGSWRHWEALCSRDWFKPHVERWRSELRVKFESDRFREMEEVVQKMPHSAQGVQATKWLAERYSSPQNKKRGRPSKGDKARALRESTEEETLLNEEAKRLGLTND